MVEENRRRSTRLQLVAASTPTKSAKGTPSASASASKNTPTSNGRKFNTPTTSEQQQVEDTPSRKIINGTKKVPQQDEEDEGDESSELSELSEVLDQDDSDSSEEDNEEDDEEDDEESSDEDTIYAQRVLAQKTKEGQKLYLIKWEGFSDDANEWIPEAEVEAALIEDFKNNAAKLKKRGRLSIAYVEDGDADEDEDDDKPARKGRKHIRKKLAVGQGSDVENGEPTTLSSDDDARPTPTRKAGMAKSCKPKADGKPVKVTKKQLLEQKKAMVKKRRTARASKMVKDLSTIEQGMEPDTSCCIVCSTREYIRAIKSKDIELLQKCLNCRSTIATWAEICTPDIPHNNALYTALDQNDLAAVKLLLEDKTVQPLRVQRPFSSRASLGYVSRTTYGHAIANLNESRGNREGNNAFHTEATPDPFSHITRRETSLSEDLAYLLAVGNMKAEVFDYWHLKEQMRDVQIYGVYEAAASGNLEMTRHLVEVLQNGYGFNSLHAEVLRPSNEGPLTAYRKNQILKKASGNYSITPLQLAAVNPDITYLKELFEKLDASDLTEPDERGRTVVHFAAGCREPTALNYLLEQKLDVSKEDKLRMTPLILAAKYGRSGNIPVILNATGSGPDHTLLKNGAHALHYAAHHGHLDAVKALVDAGAAVSAMVKKTKSTPLLLASSRGHKEVMMFLLDHGVDIEEVDRYGRQAIIHAAKNGHYDVVKMLLERGADANAPDSSDNTPLHYAAGYGWSEIVELLLDYGEADLNAANCWKYTPIMVADLKGHLKIFQQLLHKESVLVNSRDNTGATLLHKCIERGVSTKNEATRLLTKTKALLDRGADPKCGTTDNQTPLHLWAAMKLDWTSPNDDITQADCETFWKQLGDLFLEAGADINALDKEKCSPLQTAVTSHNRLQVIHLLSHQAKIEGTTIMEFLAKESAQLDASLLSFQTNTIDLNRPNLPAKHANGLTQIRHICQMLKDHHLEVVSRMVNAPDKQGHPPVVIAIKEANALQDTKRRAFGNHSGYWGFFDNCRADRAQKKLPPMQICLDSTWGAVMALIEIFVDDFGADLNTEVQLPAGWTVGVTPPAETGYTALHYAVSFQEPDLVKFLIRRRGEKTLRNEGPKLTARPTPIYLALEPIKKHFQPEVCQGDVEHIQFKSKPPREQWNKCLTLLLADGADPTEACTPQRDNALLKLARMKLKIEEIGNGAVDTTNISDDTIVMSPELLKAFISACSVEGIDKCQDVGDTPLMLFIKARNLPAAQMLASLANLNAVNPHNGETPMIVSVKTGQLDYIRALLTANVNSEKKCDLTVSDTNQMTALRHAFGITGPIAAEIAAMLLDSGLDCNVNAVDKKGNTALHFACHYGFATVVTKLLALNADPEIENKFAERPIIKTLVNEQRDALAALLQTINVEVNVKDRTGRYALHLAVRNDDWRAVKMLLGAGALVDVQDKHGRNPLHLAIQNSKTAVNTSLKIERLLVAAGAPINAVDVQGRTPLHVAFVESLLIPAMHIATVQKAAHKAHDEREARRKEQEELGKEVIELTVKDETADQWILAAPKAELVKKHAAENGAGQDMDVDDRDQGLEWFTASWERDASKTNKSDPIEIVSWLLELPGIEVDRPDKFGRTPLHYAGCVGAFTSTSYLIDRGAVADRKDRDDNTSMQIGLLYEHIDYAVMLAKLGSDVFGNVTLKNGDVVSTFRYALSRGFMSLAYMIMEKGLQFLKGVNDALSTGKYHLAVLLISRAPEVLRMLDQEKGQNLLHVVLDFTPTHRSEWEEYSVEIWDSIKHVALNPCLKDKALRQPLHYACKNGHTAIVPLLLPLVPAQSIADMDVDGRCPLSYALENGHVEIARMLLERSFGLPDETELVGPSLVHYACLLLNMPILQRLIELKAPLNQIKQIVTKKRCSPLCLAVRGPSQSFELVQTLINAGVDLNRPSESDLKDDSVLIPPIFAALDCPVPRSTPLHPTQGVLELMLRSGMNPNVVHPISGLSPLQVAEDRPDVFDVLLRYKADINVVHPEKKRTPFQVALYGVREGVDVVKSLKKLFECSPNVNLEDEITGHTLLDYAIIKDDIKLLEAALLGGADIQIRSRDNVPSLIRCATLNRKACLQRILTDPIPEAVLNEKDERGRTLLHYVVAPRSAASFENVQMLELVVQKGADMEIRDNEGLRAIDFAYAQKSKVMFTKLIVLGAKDVDPAVNGAESSEPMEVDLAPSVDPEADAEAARQEILAADERKRQAKLAKRAAQRGLTVEELERADKHAACKLDPEVNLTSDTAHVHFGADDMPYDILMNKTDVDKGYYGMNVFYKMQVVYNRVQDSYILLTRFGGVGETGMHQRTPYPTEAEAVAEFEKIFKSKTGNPWEHRGPDLFQPKPGKYNPVRPSERKSVQVPTLDFKTRPAHVADSVQSFFRIISNIPALGTAVSDSDLELALGNVDHKTVKEAHATLCAIRDTVKEMEELNKATATPDIKKLKELKNLLVQMSNKYFTLMPTKNEPRGGIRPILTMDAINVQMLKLANLMYVDSASTLLLGAHSQRATKNPVDYLLSAIECQFREVSDRTADEFKVVQEYMEGTKTAHSNYEIVHLFNVNRRGEQERFTAFADVKRKLLWHGSRSSNFLGILSQGLRVAPIEAPVSGYMFGKGIYFADMFGKSIGYADCSFSGYACLLLCDVAVGANPYESEVPKYMEKAAGDTICTLGLGLSEPAGSIVLNADGVVVPRGPVVTSTLRKDDKGQVIPRTLNYHEYIVYDPSQVRIRYVVLVRDISTCFLCSRNGQLSSVEEHQNTRFKEGESRAVPKSALSGNRFEQAVCEGLLFSRKESLEELWKAYVDRTLAEKLYEKRFQRPTRLDKHDQVCKNCADLLFSDMLSEYMTIHRAELPAAIRERPDCWWGDECRDQRKADLLHAKRVNHVCPKTRAEGDRNVFCLNHRTVKLAGMI
ncbi:ankyrin repeat-containing domain protein [Powellomyces hirtus]|nr:ankyrin repeat-containing domain protein [Powellomyces hirtus]